MDGPLTRALFWLATATDTAAFHLYRAADRTAVRARTRGNWGGR